MADYIEGEKQGHDEGHEGSGLAWTDLNSRGRDWILRECGDLAHAKAFWLVVFDGYPMAEVAEGLGLTVRQVRRTAERTRAAMQRAIRDGTVTASDFLRDPSGHEADEVVATERAIAREWAI